MMMRQKVHDVKQIEAMSWSPDGQLPIALDFDYAFAGEQMLNW